MPSEKTCSKCGAPGPFTKRAQSPDGLQGQCRPCRNTAMKEWRERNPDRARANQQAKLASHPEKYRALNCAYSRAWGRQHPEGLLVRNAKSRARIKKLPFNLEAEDITIPNNCPLLGIPLRKSEVGRVGPNSPSLDRKIPSLGYIKGNVWVISHRANVMKNDATLEELELLVRNLRASLG